MRWNQIKRKKIATSAGAGPSSSASPGISKVVKSSPKAGKNAGTGAKGKGRGKGKVKVEGANEDGDGEVGDGGEVENEDEDGAEPVSPTLAKKRGGKAAKVKQEAVVETGEAAASAEVGAQAGAEAGAE